MAVVVCMVLNMQRSRVLNVGPLAVARPYSLVPSSQLEGSLSWKKYVRPNRPEWSCAVETRVAFDVTRGVNRGSVNLSRFSISYVA